jgi:tRNA(His) 5'-end guanylyltransferase
VDTSDLANRMKDYEKRNRYYLQKRLPVIIRLDSRDGHTFTKGFKRPFDEIFMKSMQETAKYLCENIQGCQCAYIQSDEITLLLVDYEKLNTESWFDYRIDKIISISAAMATLAFNKYFTSNAEMYIDDFYEAWNHSDVEEKYVKVLKKAIKMGLVFDSRVFNLPKEEVTNNFYWRQLDASRNSIQMVGQANFSHKELQHKSCNDIQDMLMTQKGINWNDLPTYQKRGSCVVRNKVVLECDEVTEKCMLRDQKQGENNWIIDKDIPIFKGDGREYIERFVNVGEV